MTAVRTPRPLEGEDLKTLHWEDARHWLAIYTDLVRFKVRLLARVHRELEKLPPEARKAAAEDVGIIESQLDGYKKRLDLWHRRLWELQGLRLNAEASLVQHHSREAHLTRREFQLLAFLIDNPHRYFTASQLLARAWSDPGLHPEEVRNYVKRIRKILAELEVPCQLVNRLGRGYSLVIDVEP